MKHLFPLIVVLALTPVVAGAQTVQTMTYRGVAARFPGDALTRPESISFRIFDAPVGGRVVAGPFAASDLTMAEGILTARFGPIPTAALEAGRRWLEVSAGGTTVERSEIETVYYDGVDETGRLTGGTTFAPMGTRLPGTLGGAYTTMVWNGPSSNRIDLVFVGDGYQTGQLASFALEAQEGLDDLMATVPFSTYRTFFNAYRVDVSSTDSGVDNDPTPGVSKDTAMDMGFWCGGIERLLCVDVAKAYGFAAAAPAVDHVIAVANSTKYGGAGYMGSKLVTYSGGSPASHEIAIHEMGHSVARLADEYDNGDGATYGGPETTARNTSVLSSGEMATAGTKWTSWLGDTRTAFDGPVSTFEGAALYQYGLYRPSNNSKMRSLGRPFNLPSVESFIIEFYKFVRPIDDATPEGTTLTNGSIAFVDPVDPVGNPLAVQWLLDDAPIPGANGDTLDVAALGASPGPHTLAVDVTDETPLVRNAAARQSWMTERRSWTLQVSSTTLAVSETHTDARCFGGTDGSIDLSVSGGVGPYAYLWSNGATSQGLSGLAAGLYSVTVTDALGATTGLGVSVGEPPAILLSQTHVGASCGGATDGLIDLSVSGGVEPYDYLWSDGATTQDLGGLAAGLYSVTVTDANGCQDTLSVMIDENRATTSVTLASSVNPSIVGDDVILTAQASSGATGTVSFYDGEAALGIAPLDGSAKAALTVATLTAGSHTLLAHYEGDACHAPAWSGEFLQQVDPDAAPTVTVVYPAGGENLVIGSNVTFQWSASDDHMVTSVSLYLSRDGGTTYQPLASDIVNSGEFAWTVSPPGTNVAEAPVYSALLKVVARDDMGQTGEGVCGAPFSLYDATTEALLTRFDARAEDGAIVVEWSMSSRLLLRSIELKRATTETGPWTPVIGEMRRVGDMTIVLDREVKAGRIYWYRITGEAEDGKRVTLGVVSASAGGPRDSRIEMVQPNPATGPIGIELTVSRPAAMRLAVYDAQGREVKLLAEGDYGPGRFEFRWDGRSDHGVRLPSGVYLLRFRLAGRESARRFVISR